MALPSSGQITLNQVNVELGNSGTAQIDMNSAAVRGLFGVASGQISMSDGYGKSSVYVFTNEGTINGQENRESVIMSDYISSGGTAKVPSGFWIWTDTQYVAAMIIDIPCTIINEGYIIGKGGQNGGIGGPAISISSGVSGVTITNESGSYISGGGGGGGQGRNGTGGGGAGGGDNGEDNGGGLLNGVGQNGSAVGGDTGSGYGGGAGGGGAGATFNGGNLGGGGGRQFPGSGGTRGSGPYGIGGNGGGGTSAGSNGNSQGGGGGGGWAASGGTGFSDNSPRPGGSGGKAIEDNGQSYTLTNSGTIYGAT